MYPEAILPIVAHIPHAGTEIPDAVRDQFLPYPGELWREIAMVTDWYTDELFGLPGIASTQTPISRVVMDLERFIDDKREPRAAVGHCPSAIQGIRIHVVKRVPGQGRALRGRSNRLGRMMPEFAEGPEEIAGFLSISSAFYPQIEARYDALAQQWLQVHMEPYNELE